MNQTAIACTALLAATPALAQEMLNMPAATAPSPGVAIPRVQARAFLFEDSQWLLEQTLRLAYGIARARSIAADLPLQQGFFDAPRPTDGDFGLGDLELNLELRILREDLNAIDTVRASVFAGAELPTGTGGFGGDSVDPFAGAVVTAILGRHGFDAAARFTFVTGHGMHHPIFVTDTADDYANIDLGYAYRLYPEEFGEERVGAWYATLELNTAWTTGGEHEVLLSPGLLLEAPTYALELGLQLPISQDLVHAPDLRFGLLLGLRLIF
ncbi:MAG: hypothetical protein ACK5C3_03995 [bacterium]